MKKLIKKFLALLFLTQPLLAAPVEKVETYPVVILGGGVGALTSSIYLSRAGFTPLVIEGSKPGGAIAQSHNVQNWPGELNIPGWELATKIHEQAEKNGAKFLKEDVVQVDLSSFPYTITTQDPLQKNSRHTIKTYACIIGMGTTPNYLGVPGEETYWSRGVYNCAVCDGSLFKNKTVAVVGGGDAALVEAQYLSRIAQKVILLVRGAEFRTVEEKRKEEIVNIPNIEVHFQTTVQEIKGDSEKATQILVQKKGENSPTPLDIDAIFLAIGSKPNSDLFKGELTLDSKGYIRLKNDQETSKRGVFAFGDITDPVYKQAITAAGDAAKAALQAEKYLASTKELKSSDVAVLKEGKSSSKKQVVEVSSVEQFDKELKNDTVVFVDFYASWCGPCRNFAPVFEAWAKEFHGKVKFLKVNVDTLPALAHKYQVTAMPTLLVLNKNGEVIEKRVGTREISKAEELLDKLR